MGGLLPDLPEAKRRRVTPFGEITARRDPGMNGYQRCLIPASDAASAYRSAGRYPGDALTPTMTRRTPNTTVLLPEGTASFVYNPHGRETAPASTLPMQARRWIMRPPYAMRRGPAGDPRGSRGSVMSASITSSDETAARACGTGTDDLLVRVMEAWELP